VLKKIISCSLLCLVLAARVYGSEPTAQEESPGALVDRLAAAKSPSEMDELTREAVQQRIQLTEKLADLLRSSTSPELKARICFLLGAYRAERTVNELIQNIDLDTGIHGEKSKIPLWGRFPCMEALVYIGRPAREKLVHLLATREEKTVRQQALEALISIEGRNAIGLLQESLEHSQGEEARRVRGALEDIKKQFGSP
jgi:HEAT repeat protein